MNSELGPVISEHQGRFAAGGIGWYVGGLVFVSGVVSLGYALVRGAFHEIPSSLFALAVMTPWLLFLYSKWKQTLTIHQLGFVHRRILREPRVLRFDQVQDVDIYRVHQRGSWHLKGVHVEVTLFLHGGGKLVISNDIEGIEQLAAYAKPDGAGQSSVQNAAGPQGGGASPWG
ncbi:MAG: DUF6585 family protein [Polyangiales bacterium]